MESVTEIHTLAEEVRPLRYRVHEQAPDVKSRDIDWTEWQIEQQLDLAHDAQSTALLSGLRSDVAVEVTMLLDLADEAADFLLTGPTRSFEAVERQYADQLTRVARMVRAA